MYPKPYPFCATQGETCSRRSDVELCAEKVSFLPPCRRALGSLGSRQCSDIREPSWASGWRLALLEKPAGKSAKPAKKPKLRVRSRSSTLCMLPFGRFPFATSTDGLPSLLRLLRPPLWYMRQLVLLSECQRERLIGYCLRVFLRWK